MGTAERRLEILKYLCQKRYATMSELAEKFGVSVRKIHRDIYEIEVTFHTPINFKSGKYDGGIYVIGNYSFDRAYMREDELLLLGKIKSMISDKLTVQENVIFLGIIEAYTKNYKKTF